MENLGIEKLKLAISGILKLAKVVETSFEDGKVSIVEGAKIAISGFQFWNSVKDIKTLKAEWLDLDEAEKAELIAYFATEFDLKNESLELLIEQIFDAMIQLATAFKKAA
jgi:nucleoid DNA-binding protein